MMQHHLPAKVLDAPRRERQAFAIQPKDEVSGIFAGTLAFEDELQQNEGDSLRAVGNVVGHLGHLMAWGVDPSYIRIKNVTASSPIISNFQCADLTQISRDDIVSFPLPAEHSTHQAGERLGGAIPSAAEAVSIQLPAGRTVQLGERPVGPSRNGGIGRACGETGFLFTQIRSVMKRTQTVYLDCPAQDVGGL